MLVVELVVVDVEVVVVAPTKFKTETGSDRSDIVPSPTCPYVLSPQHFRSPLVSNAHVFRIPVVRASTVDGKFCTVTGTDESLLLPVPSWPPKFQPQHCTAPETSSAHVW